MGFHRRPHPQIGALLETGLIRLLCLRPDSCDLILDLLDFVLVAATFVVRDLRFKFRDLLLVLLGEDEFFFLLLLWLAHDYR